LPATLVVAEDSWLLGRVAMTLAEAEAWLGSLLVDAGDGTIVFPDVGELPSLVARLERPAAPLQVLPNIDSPASSLLAGLGRPAQALLWTASDNVDISLPQSVAFGEQWSFVPSLDLAGIHVTSQEIDAAARAFRARDSSLRRERSLMLSKSCSVSRV
jgi:hypothetical protein